MEETHTKNMAQTDELQATADVCIETHRRLTKDCVEKLENSQKEVDSLRAEVENLKAKLAKERSERHAANRAAKGKKGNARSDICILYIIASYL